MKKNILLSTLCAIAIVSCSDNESETKTTPSAPQTAEQAAEAAAKKVAQKEAEKKAAQEEAAKTKEEAKDLLSDARESLNDGDAEEALELALKAANKGNLAEAQFLVGNMYFNGQGTEKDLVKAYTWTTLSNIYKVEGSRQLLNRIYRQLSPEQRAESKAAVKAFLAKH